MIAGWPKSTNDSIWYPADCSAAEMTQEYARYRIGMTRHALKLAEQVELDDKPPPRRKPRSPPPRPKFVVVRPPQRHAHRQLARKKKRF